MSDELISVRLNMENMIVPKSLSESKVFEKQNMKLLLLFYGLLPMVLSPIVRKDLAPFQHAHVQEVIAGGDPILFAALYLSDLVCDSVVRYVPEEVEAKLSCVAEALVSSHFGSLT